MDTAMEKTVGDAVMNLCRVRLKLVNARQMLRLSAGLSSPEMEALVLEKDKQEKALIVAADEVVTAWADYTEGMMRPVVVVAHE